MELWFRHAGICNAATPEVPLPLVLGSRHIAGASMSAATRDLAVVVSESSVVRLFCHGELVAEVIPELWMIDRQAHLGSMVEKETIGELTVLTPSNRIRRRRVDKARTSPILHMCHYHSARNG